MSILDIITNADTPAPARQPREAADLAGIFAALRDLRQRLQRHEANQAQVAEAVLATRDEIERLQMAASAIRRERYNEVDLYVCPDGSVWKYEGVGWGFREQPAVRLESRGDGWQALSERARELVREIERIAVRNGDSSR
jgi:hypothetical protein